MGDGGLRVGGAERRRRLRPGGERMVAGLACGLSLPLYGWIAAAGDLPARLPLFLGIYGLLFLLYLAAVTAFRNVRGGRALVWGVGVAVVFRALLAPVPPSLSDDMRRYAWDGYLVRQGVSPYARPPAAPELAAARAGFAEAVPHPDVRSVYPPLAQGVFAAAGRSHLVLKSIFAALDVAVLLALVWILRALGLPAGRAMVYGWCPLAVVEVAGSGHLEPLAILPALIAAGLLVRGRPLASGAWLALGAAAKWLPLAWALPWARRLPLRAWAALALVTLVLWLPYLGGGAAGGLPEYGRRWEFNGSVFPLVERTLGALGPTESLKGGVTALKTALGHPRWAERLYHYTDVPFLARVAVGTAYVGFLAGLAVRRTPPLRAAYLAAGAFVILSPTVHPWYVLWVVPWLALFGNPAWLVLAAAVPLSYVAAASGEWSLPSWVPLAEYAPFYALALAKWAGRLFPRLPV